MPDNLRQVDILHLSNFYPCMNQKVNISSKICYHSTLKGGGLLRSEKSDFFVSFSQQINDKKNTSKFSHELAAR